MRAAITLSSGIGILVEQSRDDLVEELEMIGSANVDVQAHLEDEALRPAFYRATIFRGHVVLISDAP